LEHLAEAGRAGSRLPEEEPIWTAASTASITAYLKAYTALSSFKNSSSGRFMICSIKFTERSRSLKALDSLSESTTTGGLSHITIAAR
jgi:hypothetical protein